MVLIGRFPFAAELVGLQVVVMPPLADLFAVVAGFDKAAVFGHQDPFRPQVQRFR